MYEENMMDDGYLQTLRSDSAFSGTSSERHDENPKLPFEMMSKPYLIRATGNLRFDLWKPSLEQRSGVTLESGRMYVIRGTVNGTKKFESRHVGNGNPHVYVFVDGGTPGVVPGETCSLLVEALEEKRRFTVVPGKRGPVVRLSGPSMRGLGVPTEESCIVELVVREGEAGMRRVYSRWDSLLGFMELQLGGAGFAVGDAVEVIGGRRYDVGAFVEDYKVHRKRELANVELGLEGEALTAVVDGRRVLVERRWLVTHGLKVVLKLELGYDHRMMKLAFDGNTMEARFGNSDPILEWSATGSGVDVRYSRGAGMTYVMRMQEPLRSVDGLGWLAGGVRAIERPISPHGMYLLEMSDLVRETTRAKLEESDEGTYTWVRGNIGEGILKVLWQDLRMELLFDHPWSELSGNYGSRRRGPDFMVRCLDSGIVAYVEGKWQEDFVRAFSDAKDEVLDHFLRRPDSKGLRVAGAYIAILDWKVSKTAKLWVERVA